MVVPPERSLAVRAVSQSAGSQGLRIWGTAPGALDALAKTYRPLGALSYPGVGASKTNQGVVLVPLPDGACAVYAEARHKVGGREFGLSSPNHVYRR